jgi:hypothetical protein
MKFDKIFLWSLSPFWLYLVRYSRLEATSIHLTCLGSMSLLLKLYHFLTALAAQVKQARCFASLSGHLVDLILAQHHLKSTLKLSTLFKEGQTWLD